MKVPIDIPMTCHTWLHHAIPEVRKAMEAAWIKHGEPTTDPVRGALNLCEEVGEVAAEALDATREGMSQGEKAHHLTLMRHELMQVAGYAILLAVQLEGVQRKVDRDYEN